MISLEISQLIKINENGLKNFFLRAKKQKAVLFFQDLDLILKGSNSENECEDPYLEAQFYHEMDYRGGQWVVATTSAPSELSYKVCRRFHCEETISVGFNHFQWESTQYPY